MWRCAESAVKPQASKQTNNSLPLSEVRALPRGTAHQNEIPSEQKHFSIQRNEKFRYGELSF